MIHWTSAAMANRDSAPRAEACASRNPFITTSGHGTRRTFQFEQIALRPPRTAVTNLSISASVMAVESIPLAVPTRSTPLSTR